MKTITPPFVKFIIAAFILTLSFRFLLSYGLENEKNILSILSASLYGVTMFVFGWYFGKKDGEYLPIFDIGFRFHLATYCIHNGISILWVGLGFGATKEIVDTSIIVAVYWSAFLIAHFIIYLIMRKNSIKNLHKDDIFE